MLLEPKTIKYILICFIVLTMASCETSKKGSELHSHIVAGDLNIWSYAKVSLHNKKKIGDFSDFNLKLGDVVVLSNGTHVEYSQETGLTVIGGHKINPDVLNVFVGEDGSINENMFIRRFGE